MFLSAKEGALAIVPEGATEYGEPGSNWNGLIVSYESGYTGAP